MGICDELKMRHKTDNSEKLYINDKQVLSKTQLRQTLTEIENQLVTEEGVFCRCHKAIVVNK